MEFKGDIVFDEAEVRKRLKSKTGNTFACSLSGRYIDADRLYQDKGYAFVDIAPLTP